MRSSISFQRLASLRTSCKFFNFTLSSCHSLMSDLLNEDEFSLIDKICPLLSRFIEMLDINIDAQCFVDDFLKDIKDGSLPFDDVKDGE